MDSRKLTGYFLGFLAAATYGLNPLFALPLMNDGIDTSSILFFRYLLAIPIIAAMVITRGRSFAVSLKQLGMLAIFGLLMGLSSITLFESYRYMDVAIASTMLFVYPLMVAVIMALFFREKITLLTGVCLAAALSGVCLLYNGEDGATLSFVGTMFVMASSLTYAIYIVGVNRSNLSNVPTLVVTFYVLVFGLSVFGINLGIQGEVSVPQTALQWGCVGALALLPTAVSFLCTTLAITYVGSTPTAILGAMEPVTAVIVGMAAFGEQLSGREFFGLALILVAVVLVIAGGQLQNHITSIRRLFPRLRKTKK